MWRIIDTMQEFIDRQTGVRSIMCEIAADTAADLPANTADRVFILGTFATAIDTGDIYKINSAGAWILQPSQNAFSNVYTKAEIDSMVNVIYQIMMYYHNEQESTDGTITFYTLGGNVGNLIIYGNGHQNGTPTTGAPIIPDFCGTLDNTDWTIPITCAGQTTPVYLGQTPTTRRINKLVFNGDEDWKIYALSGATKVERFYLVVSKNAVSAYDIISSHFLIQAGNSDTEHMRFGGNTNNEVYIYISRTVATTVADLKSYLAQQYTNGTPVTIWYALATPETAVVNEPLCKIGDYSDELHLTKDDITIPTVSGENTLTVDTELPPSKIIISGE